MWANSAIRKPLCFIWREKQDNIEDARSDFEWYVLILNITSVFYKKEKHMGNIFIYFISCTKAMLANEEPIK